jgi:hypothetical protein
MSNGVWKPQPPDATASLQLEHRLSRQDHLLGRLHAALKLRFAQRQPMPVGRDRAQRRAFGCVWGREIFFGKRACLSPRLLIDPRRQTVPEECRSDDTLSREILIGKSLAASPFCYGSGEQLLVGAGSRHLAHESPDLFSEFGETLGE